METQTTAPEVAVAETTTTAPSAPETPAASSSTPEAAAPAVPQWAPDYKFRYTDENDQKVEGEIDEWARPLVTSKEIEENIKKIWAKAHGLDFVKNRFNKTRDELKTYRSTVDPLLQNWNDLTGLYNKGDYDGFFKGLNIPDKVLYQHVLNKLNYAELPPEQRALYDNSRAAEERAMMLERQNQALMQQQQEFAVSQRESALSQTLSRPDVSAVAEAFDSRMGKPGAFRDEVIKRGILHWQMSQQDISPDDAVKEVMSMIGGMSGVPAQAAPMAQSNSVQPQAKSPAVIPNVGAKNSSPTKRAPKSLAELKQLAESI
jgi:hypothetical protein